ncbi:MAG: gliding motility-associated C-terminal domain-containing protein [Bacteroidales bacterium]|nr:gliding motility-associated C-terminal domain-containing protein [Bacteroidales bacterium]
MKLTSLKLNFQKIVAIYSLLLSFGLLISFDCNSQIWEWAKHFTGTDRIRVNYLAYSKIDDAVVAIVAFDNLLMTIDAASYTPVGDRDILVVKFSSNGNLLWASQLGSISTESPRSIYVDNTGNVYVTGSFSNTITVDGKTIIATNDQDVFLVKYLPNGIVSWIKNVGWGYGEDRGLSITVDPANDIYITGYFNDTINFGAQSLISNGFTNNFIAKFDNTGNYISSLHFKGNNNRTRINSIAISNDGGKLVSGTFRSNLYFPNNDTLFGKGLDDLVVFKLSSIDQISWIRQTGGPGLDVGYDAKSDEFGNIYVVGQIEGTVQVDSTGKSIFDGSPITSNGSSDVYFAKYNKQGRLIWKKNFGGSGDDLGRGIEINQNLIHFGGHISDTVILGFDTLATTGLSDNDAFFGIINSDGNYISSQHITGNGTDRALSITYDTKGVVYLGGFFNSDVLNVGSIPLTNAAPPSDEGFLAKWQTRFSIAATSINNVDCKGGSNGKIIVTPYFGTYPYTYNWDFNPALHDSTASNLTAGDYKIIVTDFNGKTDSLIVPISEPDSIIINKNITNIQCFEENTGEIDITVSGGTVAGDYSYSWQTDVGSGIATSEGDQTGLSAANYYLTVTDDNLCKAYDTSFVSQPPAVSFSGSVVDRIVIPPGSNGAVTLNPVGGTTPYLSYNWSGPGFTASTEDITGLVNAGIYNITVTDAYNCVFDTSFLVANDTALIAYISYKKNISCNGGSDGEAIVSLENGSGNYNFSWTDGSSPVGGNFDNISNRTEGTYYVTVTDQISAKTAETYVILTEPLQALSLGINSTDITCNGYDNGIIDLQVTGGTLPYSYSWTGPASFTASTEDLINIAEGNYFVTVTDKNDCFSSISEEIIEPDPMVITISQAPDDEIKCYGDLTANLEASTAGGLGPYAYLWNDPGNTVGFRVEFLGVGTYTVTVTDNDGCEASNDFDVDQPGDIVIVPTLKDVTCFNDGDGAIQLAVSGGTPGYGYSWSNFESTKDITGLSAGIYTVTVTDFNICQKTATDTIFEPSEITYLLVDTTNPSCFGYLDGEINISASGGTGSYNFSVDNGTNYQSSGAFTGLSANTYILKIQDANLCESQDSTIILTQPPGITILSESFENVTCFGYADASILITAEGGAGGLTFSIDNGDTFFDNNGNFTNLVASDYPVVVKDIDNCEVPGSVVNIIQPDELIIDTISVIHVSAQENGSVTLDATGGSAPITFWAIPEISDSLDNSSGLFADLLAGAYKFYAIDNNNCNSNSLQVQIYQLSGNALIIYDAFSPNGDGKNEVWNIGNIEIYDNPTIQIFNVWGNKVFSSTGYAQPWDGTYNGKELPAGTYYYVIDLGDGSETLSGPVNIVK